MALFSSLGDRLNHIFSKMTKRGRLSELEIKDAMREVRVALLEADVNYAVAKKFISEVSEEAIGEKIINSLTPGQHVIKLVRDKLSALMGESNVKLAISPKPPTVILMCGLQGSGKTTMAAKLAKMLKGQGKKPLLVACDIHRPAAIDQLKILGNSIKIDVFEKGTNPPHKTVKEAIDYAKKFQLDTVIIDTAGRLHIDAELMNEIKAIKKVADPTEILLVVDSMTGQDAVNVASSFDESLNITGVVLTKIDGDTRGGAALSIRAVTGKPIKYCGVGEKLDDLEVFHPDRIASRILGMGDVLTLIDKAQDIVDEKQAKDMERKFRENSFTFDDYLTQMDTLKKMGGLESVLSRIPGIGNKVGAIDSFDENMLKRQKAIIQSMTPHERLNPNIINGSRRKRIARGCGQDVSDINRLLKQFEDSKKMMQQMKNQKGFKKMF